MPSLQRRRNVRVDFAVEFSSTIALLPDLSLKLFERGRFPVLIHQPVHVGEWRPWWRGRALRNIDVVFQLQRTLGLLIQMFMRMRTRILKSLGEEAAPSLEEIASVAGWLAGRVWRGFAEMIGIGRGDGR